MLGGFKAFWGFLVSFGRSLWLFCCRNCFWQRSKWPYNAKEASFSWMELKWAELNWVLKRNRENVHEGRGRERDMLTVVRREEGAVSGHDCCWSSDRKLSSCCSAPQQQRQTPPAAFSRTLTSEMHLTGPCDPVMALHLYLPTARHWGETFLFG